MYDDSAAQAYITDTRYPVTYFRELSPVWLNYVAVLNGTAPRPLDERFDYLELGCGSGFSSLVHAAAYPGGRFQACDLNPANIAAAAALAQDLGIGNVEFLEATFEALGDRDLPIFDYIVLHGVYSWVAPDVRRAVRRLVRSRLRPGGLLYVSYNCLPGWAVEVPLRRLVNELADRVTGDSARRAAVGVDTLARLAEAGLNYFEANPAARRAVGAYRHAPATYLAHEFVNGPWDALYSVDVMEEMQEAGVSYLGSATLPDNHVPLTLGPRAVDAIAVLPTARQRELAMDFAVNRQFRRDVFVRGPRAGGSPDPELLNRVVLGCPDDPATLATSIQVPRGRISFHPGFIGSLRRVMQRGSAPLGQVAAELEERSTQRNEVVRNLLYLVAAGTLAPFAKPLERAGRRVRGVFARGVVEPMLDRVVRGALPGRIPSEVVGGAVSVSAAEAAVLLDAPDRRRDPNGCLTARLIRLGLLV